MRFIASFILKTSCSKIEKRGGGGVEGGIEKAA